MFTNFFFYLRAKGLNVTPDEWLTFMECADKGMVRGLDDLYSLGRTTLVKSEKRFDRYDLCFAEYFKGQTGPEVRQEVLEWLASEVRRVFTEAELEALKALPLDKLFEEFKKRLEEQKEAHHGGNRWIGTGGTSPFGHSGVNPAGMRVGGEGGGRSAVQMALARRFRDYRQDRELKARDFAVVLRNLRDLARTGPEALALPETIDASARNAGDIDLVFERERNNRIKILLLTDTGGSMNTFVELVEQFFAAAKKARHFKEFEHFAFHNCVYHQVYESIYSGQATEVTKLLRNHTSEWKLILVGDAMMGLSELIAPYGSIEYADHCKTPGIVWLQRLRRHFPSAVWLNPVRKRWWQHPTVRRIGRIYPMFELTLEGLKKAVRVLKLNDSGTTTEVDFSVPF